MVEKRKAARYDIVKHIRYSRVNYLNKDHVSIDNSVVKVIYAI